MFNITHATLKGARPYQEDRFVVRQNEQGTLLAVFDGHGGSGVSDWCADVLKTTFDSFVSDHAFPDYLEVLKCVFISLDTHTDSFDEGSTASIVYIPSGTRLAYVGVLGDSPVIINPPKSSGYHPNTTCGPIRLKRKPPKRRVG
jgi:serine/threonine protein phosphatase PrpC